jgi:hypothetical protein
VEEVEDRARDGPGVQAGGRVKRLLEDLRGQVAAEQRSFEAQDVGVVDDPVDVVAYRA